MARVFRRWTLLGGEREVRRHLDVLGDGPRARQAARPLVREVRPRERRHDPFGSARGVEAHVRDAGAWVRAPHDDHVDRAGEREVVETRAKAIGTSVKRKEDASLLRGRGTFVPSPTERADLTLQ